jgi:diguanylate cyclase (GGDEF)-like protein
MSRQVRASDVVARLGGDEFAVLLWHVRAADAEAKAAALEGAIGAIRVAVGAAEVSVGASAGVAMLGALDAPEDVLAAADRAMYARKAARNGGAPR